MTLLVGKHAPNFNSFAIMPDGSFKSDFNLDNYRDGRAMVVFFYQLDYSQICTTELIAINNRLKEFEARNVAVVAVSTDSQLSHIMYRNHSPQEGGIGNIGFPLVPDMNRTAGRAYDILIHDAFALRGTFILDEMGVVRYQQVNDLPVGRNIDEILRFIDAFQHHVETGYLCPANWKKGDAAIAPEDNFAKEYLKENSGKLAAG